MPVSNGLLVAGGIGNALSTGVDAFLRARGLRDEQAERERQAQAQQQQMGLMAAREGLVYSPELGSYQLSPEGYEDRQRAKARDEAEMGLIGARTAEARAHARMRTGGGDGVRPNKDLAPDERAQLTAIGTKVANKLSIADSIDQVMSTWDQLPDDQKIVQGLSLLKTLNSPEGADAIGAEEAKRLGAKIQFAMGFNPARLGEFGRDLEGFATQSRDTSKNIRASANKSQSRADQIMGRKPRAGILPEGGETPVKPKPPWALR